MKQEAQTLLGTVLDGRYRIEGMLGEGGMGAVYSAIDLRLDKRVAAKVMARELTANPDALARFHREAMVTSGLGHPHIVQVFDFSTTPSGEPFMVMEFLEGEDLERRLRRDPRLPASEVVHIVRQVAAALAVTHAKAVVHRDLKPGNIYLLEVAGESNFVKVLDFGISKVRSATTKLTRTASVMGTPNYMSPEQAMGKVDEIDERTDQWALACIAWECLAGEGPFVGENVPSILFQIVHEPPLTLPPNVTKLHPQIGNVLLRALAKNKNERFAGVNDFATALESAASGTTLSPAPRRESRTMQLHEEAFLVRKCLSSTTLGETAGEVDDINTIPRRPKWIWGAVIGGAAVVLIGLLFFFLAAPAAKPFPSAPASTATSPSSPPTPPPPPHSATAALPEPSPLLQPPSAMPDQKAPSPSPTFREHRPPVPPKNASRLGSTVEVAPPATASPARRAAERKLIEDL